MKSVIKIWNDRPSDKQLDEICDTLQSGAVIIIPTDTIYAICCDALNVKAIERICKIKGLNPEKNELSIICSDISMASEYSRITNTGFQLLKEYTPGPFTFLMKAASTLPKAFKGRKVAGIRIPDNGTARQIVERLGHPLMTTSIQFQDEDYGTEPGLIAEQYDDKADMMVEGERGGTIPSTIIDCTEQEPIVIRQGIGELQ